MNAIAKKKVFITGGAGFIGSNLVNRLLAEGCKVTAYDNLSLGKKKFLEHNFSNPDFKFIQGDLLHGDALKKNIANHDIVFHMAANSEINVTTQSNDIDLKQGTLATYNLLEAMNVNGIKEIIFASSSTVYGESKIKPTPENYGPLLPISLYGASKLACEGLLSAFCHCFGHKAWIFRFANIIGRNSTHGVIYDFIKKLRKNNKTLEVLGDGNQSKPYLHVSECIAGMLYGYFNAKDKLNIFNLSCDGFTSVKTIAKSVIDAMGLQNVTIKFGGGNRGWSGDVPQVILDASKLKSLGWKSNYASDEAVKRGIKELLQQI